MEQTDPRGDRNPPSMIVGRSEYSARYTRLEGTRIRDAVRLWGDGIWNSNTGGGELERVQNGELTVGETVPSEVQ